MGVSLAGLNEALQVYLGTAVFCGMLGVTVFGLLFTPVFDVVLRRFAGDRSMAPLAARLEAIEGDKTIE